ncbi:hypothetical protein ACFO5X_13050 [Seohaeicola nanhaiensis]|uniref:Uncharacterized protein n=1 Tax=Seohaeicola nanhaiensis TaxID=1387282 RepID=A0ABV9KHG8_9RHOB
MDRATFYAEGETAQQRLYANLREGDKWLDSPMIVSIETYAKSNAACTFCPYPDLERQGTRLDRYRVLALIDAVAGFARPPARLNLSRVNEPLLDPSDRHDQDFLDWCAREFPAFPASSSARFDWIGTAISVVEGAAPDAGCSQWFSLHILSDGDRPSAASTARARPGRWTSRAIRSPRSTTRRASGGCARWPPRAGC